MNFASTSCATRRPIARNLKKLAKALCRRSAASRTYSCGAAWRDLLPASSTPVAAATNAAQAADSTKLNPLAPYYLVYVHDDGTVRFSFAQPKETILLLRDPRGGRAERI